VLGIALHAAINPSEKRRHNAYFMTIILEANTQPIGCTNGLRLRRLGGPVRILLNCRAISGKKRLRASGKAVVRLQPLLGSAYKEPGIWSCLIS